MWSAPENEQPVVASPENAEHKGRNREEHEEMTQEIGFSKENEGKKRKMMNL